MHFTAAALFCVYGMQRWLTPLMFVCACAVSVTTMPQAVIYAATCDWDADKRTKADGSPLLPHEDLRYYARGVFTWPQVSWHAL
jgi:hypothetical protein